MKTESQIREEVAPAIIAYYKMMGIKNTEKACEQSIAAKVKFEMTMQEVKQREANRDHKAEQLAVDQRREEIRQSKKRLAMEENQRNALTPQRERGAGIAGHLLTKKSLGWVDIHIAGAGYNGVNGTRESRTPTPCPTTIY